MPNTKILEDVEGESVDAPKKFTNIDNEEFEFTWDSKVLGGVLGSKKVIKPGETVIMPKYLVNYAAMHLARKMNKRDTMAAFKGSEVEKANSNIKFVSADKEMELQKKMVEENFVGEKEPARVPTTTTTTDKTKTEDLNK